MLPLRVLLLRSPLLQALQLEEALFRADDGCWMIFNRVPVGQRAVVLGISGQAEQMLHVDNCKADGIEIIRRFSGGGTVFVDDTMPMVSLILKHSEMLMRISQFNPLPTIMPPLTVTMAPTGTTAIPSTAETTAAEDPFSSSFSLSPRAVMQWSAGWWLRSTLLRDFVLRENDYCIRQSSSSSPSLNEEDERKTLKFGGNAQSLGRDRFCHHTSVLWQTACAQAMERYLTIPNKQPQYRQKRKSVCCARARSFLCPPRLTTEQTLRLYNTACACIFIPQRSTPSAATIMA